MLTASVKLLVLINIYKLSLNDNNLWAKRDSNPQDLAINSF
jgi:hypothetical protein